MPDLQKCCNTQTEKGEWSGNGKLLSVSIESVEGSSWPKRLEVLPPSEIGLFLVLLQTARIIPPRPSCICSLGAPSLQWLYWKWLEEYDGDRSSSGDLAQGFGNMEFFRPGRDISENHLVITRISKSCVVTWIIKVRTRTQIWCSGSGVLFLHKSGSVLLTGLCVYTHYPSQCFWKQNLFSVS